MSKTQNFSVQNYDNLNEKVYRHKASQTHIFHSLEWMKIIHDAFGIKYKIAMIKEKDEILASIPFVTYRNLLKGPCALPLQFSGF